MQTSVTTEGSLGRKIHISIPHADIEAKVKREVQSMSKRVRIDGFRPGKVPANVVEQRYGTEIFHDVVKDAMRDCYVEALEKEEISPAGNPRFENISAQRGQDISFDAHIEVYPEFKVAEMGSVKIEVPSATISEADLEAMVERVRKNQTIWQTAGREARNGDRLSFHLVMPDEPDKPHGSEPEQKDKQEGGQEDDKVHKDAMQIILGEDDSSAQFSEQLIGARSGETRTVTINTPNPAGSDGEATQNKTHTVRIESIEEGHLPELNEEFYKQCGVEEGNLQGLHKLLKEGMQKQIKASTAQLTRSKVMDALLGANHFDIPQTLVQEEIESIRKRTMQRMQMPEADAKTLPDDLFTEHAQRRVKLGLLLQQFSEQYHISVDEDAFDAKVEELVEEYDEPEKLRHYYQNDRKARSYVEATVMEDRVVKQVLELATVEEKTCSFDELMKEASSQSEV